MRKALYILKPVGVFRKDLDEALGMVFRARAFGNLAGFAIRGSCIAYRLDDPLLFHGDLSPRTVIDFSVRFAQNPPTVAGTGYPHREETLYWEQNERFQPQRQS